MLAERVPERSIHHGSGSWINLPEDAELIYLQNADNPSKSGINFKYVCDTECDWCKRGAHPAEVKVDYERDECDGCPLLPYHVAQIWADGRLDEFPYGPRGYGEIDD